MSNITLVFAPDPAGGAYDAPPDPLPYGVSISAPWLCCHPPTQIPGYAYGLTDLLTDTLLSMRVHGSMSECMPGMRY